MKKTIVKRNLKRKFEINNFNNANINWVLTPDEVIWLRFYNDFFKEKFLNTHGYCQIHRIRHICFQKALNLFGRADTLEKSSPGFLNKMFHDFEKVIFLTEKPVITNILKNCEKFTYNLWDMGINIGDFFFQNRVYVLASYLMHASPEECIYKELRHLRNLSNVFETHFLKCLPRDSSIQTQLASSRRFLNLFNMSRLHRSNVISIEAFELSWGVKTLRNSVFQQKLWIDFNFVDPYVSVFCTNFHDGTLSEVNLIFQVKKLSLGSSSYTMTIVAVPPVKMRLFGGTQEITSYEDILIFSLTEDGYCLANHTIKKLKKIEIKL